MEAGVRNKLQIASQNSDEAQAQSVSFEILKMPIKLENNRNLQDLARRRRGEMDVRQVNNDVIYRVGMRMYHKKLADSTLTFRIRSFFKSRPDFQV